MTFEVLSWDVKGEGMSVNEGVYSGTVGPDRRRRWCEVYMVAMEWCCSALKGKEVSSFAGDVVTRP
jgi:hypothetical protein